MAPKYLKFSKIILEKDNNHIMAKFRCVNNCNKSVDDGFPTFSYNEQYSQIFEYSAMHQGWVYPKEVKVEESIEKCYKYFKECLDVDIDIPALHRTTHDLFLTKGLQLLSESYECLDASRPWLCYWILHSMELLQIPISDEMTLSVCQFLLKCQDEAGGFGGGPGQLPHLAPTYAAVNALCILATDEAYQVINRDTLKKFLLARRYPDGSFTMHEGGEVDIRGAYCAASVARLLNIADPAIFENTAEWIIACQTYEGGFSGYPGQEAHGGYSFCGLAALILLGHEKLCDLKALLRWTTSRQMAYEGGFQGRTNKLVDGCYSFWQGAALPLLQMVLAKEGDTCLSAEHWLFDQQALQEYLLICCQHPGGGLIDKPGKHRDYYHTCYCLSGLSIAQHFMEGKIQHSHVIGKKENELATCKKETCIVPSRKKKREEYFTSSSCDLDDSLSDNLQDNGVNLEMMKIHPVFNIGRDAVIKANRYFNSLQ